MMKLFDKNFFKLAVQFFLIVSIGFAVLLVAGYIESKNGTDNSPEPSTFAAPSD